MAIAFLNETENNVVIYPVSDTIDSLWQLEVDDATLERWRKVLADFEQAQEEMGKLIRDSYNKP